MGATLTIAVIDYGMGNVGSMRNMLAKIGVETVVTSDPEVIMGASKVILPGVGAFDNAMRRLEQLDLVAALDEKVREQGTPFLGVCLGMQLLTMRSEEGELPGLGWIDAETRLFDLSDHPELPIPHMGWNTVQDTGRGPLLVGQADGARFYFVHSYRVQARSEDDVLGVTNYGGEFASVIGHGNIWGVQFHPEKSHRYGMTLLNTFATTS